jgi:hypothetical protein
LSIVKKKVPNPRRIRLRKRGTKKGPVAVLGYARKHRKADRSTAEWMKEIRSGEV